MQVIPNVLLNKNSKKIFVSFMIVMIISPILIYYYIPDKVYSFFLEQGPYHIPAYDTPTKGYLFIYTNRYKEISSINTLVNYKVIITDDFLAASNISYLHSYNVKLIYYEYFIGTDDSNIVPNKTWIIGTGTGPSGVFYFYDFGNKEFQDWFVNYIYNKIKEHSYDGVFFDYFGPKEYHSGIAKGLYVKYTQKHPLYPIESAMQNFLQKLRSKLQNKIIISKEGYKSGVDFLRFVDYDVSNSLFATYGERKTIYVEGVGLRNVSTTFVKPWNIWSLESPRFIITNQIGSVLNELREKYGRTVEILHLNYLGPYYVPSGKTVEINGTNYNTFIYRENNPYIEAYCYAGALMFDQYSQPTIMIDLGAPLTNIIDLYNGTVSVRYFENGFILINGANKSISFKPNMEFVRSTILFDHVTGEYYFLRRSGYILSIPITVEPVTNETIPTVRIFLYAYTFTK